MIIKVLKFLVFLLIFSCSTSDEPGKVNYQFENDVKMYNNALKSLKKKEYDIAVDIFNELELQHPYSKWASKGQVMAGFALYSNNKYDEAILTLSKFIELNPNHNLIPYAMYLKGFSYFERIPDIKLDQKFSILAHEVFSELQNRFPNSNYTKKSINHLKTLNNHLASKEMDVGRFYQSQGFTLAGIKRYKVVLKKYRQTIHVPESIFRLIECYISLGLKKQSLYLYRILKYNFANSDWSNEASNLLKTKNINKKLRSLKKKELDINKLNPEDFDLI